MNDFYKKIASLIKILRCSEVMQILKEFKKLQGSKKIDFKLFASSEKID